MTLTRTLFVIGCLFVATVAWELRPTTTRAGAEPRQGRQKWEYASLVQVFPPAQPSYRVIWRTGKDRLVAETKTPGEGVAKLYKGLAGHDLGAQKAPFGALLDRIGQDGWELVVTYVREPVPGGAEQTWMFKRPVP